jgi:ribosomal protein L11 methyltransferase
MYELVLLTTESQVESLSETLLDLEAVSVAVEDADANTPAEQALFGKPGMPPPQEGWRHSVLQALFADEDRATKAAAAVLAAQEGVPGVEVQALRKVADQDWVRLTQSQFEPVAITPNFWIVPSWHRAPAQATHIIRLDPGLAFGTGTHPTTQMCLRWIACHAQSWPRVLDYGCGSGILAIGAALHGAVRIDAVDIDASAVDATRDNAAVNHVENQLNCGFPELAHGTYGVVLANILATPLKLLAPLLTSHVASGGHLVLAGILERQASELRQAYSPMLDLQVVDTLEGWILMTAQRLD